MQVHCHLSLVPQIRPFGTCKHLASLVILFVCFSHHARRESRATPDSASKPPSNPTGSAATILVQRARQQNNLLVCQQCSTFAPSGMVRLVILNKEWDPGELRREKEIKEKKVAFSSPLHSRNSKWSTHPYLQPI